MLSINPTEAVQLARDVYAVQDESQVGFFLDNPLFRASKTGSIKPHQHLKAEVGGRIILNYKDGFGICAVGGPDHKDQIFLIFRGTTMENKRADVLTDAKIGITMSSTGLPIHCGFHHCFSSMLPKIREFFNAYKGIISAVHCVGHSLGGAIASLAADWVSKELKHPTRLYTFGAPRVGTDWFVKSTTTSILAKNIHRVYHRTDPVPMVPLYPFMHAPYNEMGHYISSAQPLTSGAAHLIKSYATSVDGKTWDQLCEVPDQPYTVESAIEAWLKSKSPVDTSSAAFWRWIDSAIIYVLKKIAMSKILSLQAAFIGVFTVADRVAYILAAGIDLAENICIWVVHLMRKLMQALGMAVAKTKEELTRSLIRYVLIRLTEKANREARDAIRKL